MTKIPSNLCKMALEPRSENPIILSTLYSQTSNATSWFSPHEKTEKQRKKKMATVFLSTAKTFLYSLSSSPSPPPPPPNSIQGQKPNVRPQLTLYKGVSDSTAHYKPPTLTKRNLSLSLTTSFLFSIAGQGYNSASNAAILEADDDVELLERVKKDRQKSLRDKELSAHPTRRKVNWLICLFFWTE